MESTPRRRSAAKNALKNCRSVIGDPALLAIDNLPFLGPASGIELRIKVASIRKAPERNGAYDAPYRSQRILTSHVAIVAPSSDVVPRRLPLRPGNVLPALPRCPS